MIFSNDLHLNLIYFIKIHKTTRHKLIWKIQLNICIVYNKENKINSLKFNKNCKLKIKLWMIRKLVLNPLLNIKFLKKLITPRK